MTAALNDEWRRDYERRLAVVPADWWKDARLAGFTHVVEALAAIEDASTTPTRREEVLSALAELARVGDRDAARVLIQFLLPCFVRVAFSRHHSQHRSRGQALDDLVVTAWEVVRTGVELQGRTVTIALLRTIEHRALRQPLRVAGRQAGRELLVEEMGERVYEPWLMSGGTNPGEVVVRLLAEAARNGLSDHDTRLLGRLLPGTSRTHYSVVRGSADAPATTPPRKEDLEGPSRRPARLACRCSAAARRPDFSGFSADDHPAHLCPGERHPGVGGATRRPAPRSVRHPWCPPGEPS